RTPLFTPGQRIVAAKSPGDHDLPPIASRDRLTGQGDIRREDPRKIIDGSAIQAPQTAKERSIKGAPMPTVSPVQNKDDEDDNWGGLPSFLRRK
ncbi:MAG TPA: hypothetical protein VI483_01445, partial [Candidatus Paceibacterota bacterium]